MNSGRNKNNELVSLLHRLVELARCPNAPELTILIRVLADLRIVRLSTRPTEMEEQLATDTGRQHRM